MPPSTGGSSLEKGPSRRRRWRTLAREDRIAAGSNARSGGNDEEGAGGEPLRGLAAQLSIIHRGRARTNQREVRRPRRGRLELENFCQIPSRTMLTFLLSGQLGLPLFQNEGSLPPVDARGEPPAPSASRRTNCADCIILDRLRVGADSRRYSSPLRT